MADSTVNSNTATATFGAGCFWCVEAIFQSLNGVHSVESGYSGGKLENPTYDDVTSGSSGHAEVCQIIYDPAEITYSNLLMVFWQTHDPTTVNRQGNDVGTQYRSLILFHNKEQQELAEEYIKQLDLTGNWGKPIVTQIEPFEKFYKAENYHQEYFYANPNAPYCKYIIQPKLDKFEKVFKDRLKSDTSN
jgi:peptide-methionine (S)-S-oxide reductase